MPKPEQRKRRNKPADYKVPEEERMIDIDLPDFDPKTTKPPAGSVYTGDRFNWIDIGDDFALTDDTEELEPPPTPQATPEAVRRKEGMDALRRTPESSVVTPEPSVVTPESQPSRTIVVAEFTATVNRSKPQWRRLIDKTNYHFVNPILTVEHFPVSGCEITMEKFIDLDFSKWRWNITTQDILKEAERLGCIRMDRAASESSLIARHIGPNGRSVACICTDVWKDSGLPFVGVVIGDANGRNLDVHGLKDYWFIKNWIFRFFAPK